MMMDQITLFVRNVDFALSVEIANNTDAGGKMDQNKEFAFGFIIGWFVVLSPILFYYSHSIIWSLTDASLGLLIAIAILSGWFSR